MATTYEIITNSQPMLWPEDKYSVYSTTRSMSLGEAVSYIPVLEEAAKRTRKNADDLASLIDANALRACAGSYLEQVETIRTLRRQSSGSYASACKMKHVKYDILTDAKYEHNGDGIYTVAPVCKKLAHHELRAHLPVLLEKARRILSEACDFGDTEATVRLQGSMFMVEMYQREYRLVKRLISTLEGTVEALLPGEMEW